MVDIEGIKQTMVEAAKATVLAINAEDGRQSINGHTNGL